MKIFSDFFIDLGYVLLAINFILYFINFWLKPPAFKIVAFYLLLTSIIQLYMSYLTSIKNENLHLSHYYFIGQFILLSFFYLKLTNSIFLKKIIPLTLVAVIVTLGVYYIKYPEDYYKFNVLEINITSIPLLIYAFAFFIQKTESLNKNFIYFNSGIFIYLLCSTLLFSSGNLKIKKEINLFLWFFNSILYVIFQILIFVEWYKNFRPKALKSKK